MAADTSQPCRAVRSYLGRQGRFVFLPLVFVITIFVMGEPEAKCMKGAEKSIRDLRGSIVAIITPMFENGDLDIEAYKKLLAWHAAEGTQGIVVMGTTGESVTMREEEWECMVKTTVELKAG